MKKHLQRFFVTLVIIALGLTAILPAIYSPSTPTAPATATETATASATSTPHIVPTNSPTTEPTEVTYEYGNYLYRVRPGHPGDFAIITNRDEAVSLYVSIDGELTNYSGYQDNLYDFAWAPDGDSLIAKTWDNFCRYFVDGTVDCMPMSDRVYGDIDQWQMVGDDVVFIAAPAGHMYDYDERGLYVWRYSTNKVIPIQVKTDKDYAILIDFAIAGNKAVTLEFNPDKVLSNLVTRKIVGFNSPIPSLVEVSTEEVSDFMLLQNGTVITCNKVMDGGILRTISINNSSKELPSGFHPHSLNLVYASASPDGTKIAFEDYEEENGFILDLDSMELTMVGKYFGEPYWLDNATIAWDYWPDGHGSQIALTSESGQLLPLPSGLEK